MSKDKGKPPPSEEVLKTLDDLYNNPESPAAFAGVDRLWQEAKRVLGRKVKKRDIIYFLQGHRTYGLMKPRRVHFPRRKFIASGWGTDVNVDLADFRKLADENEGNNYLLVAVDVLSKRIFAVPVKTKGKADMVDAFKRLLAQMPFRPHRIFSDLGTEFTNSAVKEFLKGDEETQFAGEGIVQWVGSYPTVKASLSERAIRTLKQKLYRYFAEKQTLNWTGVLDKIVSGLNNSKSRTHGMKPIDVNHSNAQHVHEILYGDTLKGKSRKKPKLKAGDSVRMSLTKGVFQKGYLPSWNDEILVVNEVKSKTNPIMAKVKDEEGEPFKGQFYPEELQKIRKDKCTTYRVEEVIRSRKKKGAKGVREYLVKFLGDKKLYWLTDKHFV
jgi:hypothetical protein